MKLSFLALALSATLAAALPNSYLVLDLSDE